jgi:hypothetical protein
MSDLQEVFSSIFEVVQLESEICPGLCRSWFIPDVSLSDPLTQPLSLAQFAAELSRKSGSLVVGIVAARLCMGKSWAF